MMSDPKKDTPPDGSLFPLPLPVAGQGDRVILFDGVCVLCSHWARFLIRFDTQRRYKLATVQSEEGQVLLKWCGLPTDYFATLVFLDQGRPYYQSSAILRILMGMGFPWKIAALFFLLPRPVRDWAYGHLARNRYRLFGQYPVCQVPTPDHQARFLGAKRP